MELYLDTLFTSALLYFQPCGFHLR